MSFMSLCLFQLFFLFLFTRFLRLLAEPAESEADFKFMKPGCEAATRFNRLADAMLGTEERKHVSSSFVL